MASQIEVREGQVVEAILSRWRTKYVYEGCLLVLKDGEMCALSVNRQQRGNQVPIHYRRDRWDHKCCAEGQGVHGMGFP